MPVVDMAVIRIPYVKSYVDRFGKVRRYFRMPGSKMVPLPGTPGSAEFMEAYQDALGAKAPPPTGNRKPGSVAALITDYLSSAGFQKLKPNSRTGYRIVLDRFGIKHGHRMVHDMPRAKVAAYIHEIGAERPGMANLTRKVLRRLLGHAVRFGYRTDNPVTEIDSYKLGTRHTWTDAELAGFEARWPLGTRERLAYALLLHTAQRVGDVAKMRRADISGGMIAVVQQKTGTALSIPIHPELAEALKAGPTNGLNLIGAPDGRPIAAQGLALLMKRAVATADLPAHCLPHGLRKAQMRRLAESGASTKEIAAVSGHKTLVEVERYTAAADQRRLSRGAIAKLQPRTERDE
jgi:site-specific recombinase XerD